MTFKTTFRSLDPALTNARHGDSEVFQFNTARASITLGGDLTNTATFEGDVVFVPGKKDNTVNNSGLIDGTIDFNVGNDKYVGQGDGMTTGLVSGGEGDDVFIFKGNTGNDKITDFKNGSDRLNLKQLDIASFKEIKNSDAIQSDGSGGTIIDLGEIGGNGRIRIDDMGLGDWNKADFIL